MCLLRRWSRLTADRMTASTEKPQGARQGWETVAGAALIRARGTPGELPWQPHRVSQRFFEVSAPAP
jgi:hypothetical protein